MLNIQYEMNNCKRFRNAHYMIHQFNYNYKATANISVIDQKVLIKNQFDF